MPAEDDPKETVKEPVKNLVKEVLSDVIYKITKAGTKRAINELRQELAEKSISRLQSKLKDISERQLDKYLKESTERVNSEITQQGIQREDLLRDVEKGFRQSFKNKLSILAKAPILKTAAVITLCIIAVGAGVYISLSRPWEPENGQGVIDTILPRVTVHYTPRTPEPGERVTFIVEAADNVGIERIELLVNGELVERSYGSTCVFEGGPYEEGAEISCEAYAYDEAGNRASSGKQYLQIPVSEKYPDLVIVKVWHEWTTSKQQTPAPVYVCIIHYVIQNRGEAEAGTSSVRLLYEERNQAGILLNQFVEWNDVNPVPGGGEVEGVFPPYILPTSGFVVELCADGKENINEANEDNNCWVYEVPPLG